MRKRVQVLLSVMPGSEPWLLVRHAKGWFKVPATAKAWEIYEGAVEGWRQRDTRSAEGSLWVRVPLELALQVDALKKRTPPA